MKLSKKLFYLIAFLLPINLGKHFILPESYVKGLLVDYLIPTIYVQDILILILVVAWFYELFKTKDLTRDSLRKLFFSRDFVFVYYFVFSIFLSVLVSPLITISLSNFVRLFLYFLLYIYMYTNFSFEKNSHTLIGIITSGFFLVSILGIFQFIRQSSVFNNYLFLGEQPYTLSTPGITLESFLGFTVVPSYGLFRHPNVFGGLLSILIIWVISKLKHSKLYSLYLLVMLLALMFTFSWFSYISLLIGLGIYFFSGRVLRKYLAPSVLVFFLLSLTLPLITSYFGISLGDTSILRRSNLLSSSFAMSEGYPMYGVGLGIFTNFAEEYLMYMNSVRFLQPVHNVFILILAESGIISFAFFIYLIFNLIVKLTNISKSNPWLLASLVQFIFLSCFDHYFWTIHQPLLFLWILLGLGWTMLKDY